MQLYVDDQEEFNTHVYLQSVGAAKARTQNFKPFYLVVSFEAI
jgi:hypothetical protein